MQCLFQLPARFLIAAVLSGPMAAAQACPPLSDDSAASLSASDLFGRVAVCHPDVRAAEQTLAGTRADLLTAAQRPNPQLTLGAVNLSRDLGSGRLWDKTFDHQVRIDQLIERGDKPGLRVAAADALRAAAQADLAEVLRQSRLTTLRNYHDLRAALARRAELQATATLYDESRRALERRVAAGDAAPLDAVRFQLDALRLQADLRQAVADARVLRLQMASMIGAETQAEQLTPTPLELSMPKPTPSELTTPKPTPQESVALDAASPPANLDRRPDVLAAQARLDAARAARALARALKTRDVSVGVQLDRYPVSDTNTSGTGNTLSLVVSIPLFVRHAYEGENARAEADVNSAEEVLRRVRVAAQTDVERASGLRQAAQLRRRLIALELLPAAERVASGAELAYRRGASSVLDVLDARRALRAAYIERITAEADFAKAASELDAATQSVDLRNAATQSVNVRSAATQSTAPQNVGTTAALSPP